MNKQQNLWVIVNNRPKKINNWEEITGHSLWLNITFEEQREVNTAGTFVFLSRKLRPTKSSQQIKEEQIIFLLKDVEKKLEEYKKTIELKDKQLTVAKKCFNGAKNSYNSLVMEK